MCHIWGMAMTAATTTSRGRAIRNGFIWGTVGFVTVVAVIILLTRITTLDGKPILEDPATMIAAAIAAFGGVGGLLVKSALNAEKKVEEVRDHVANSHKYPDGSPLFLRDDLDARFAGLEGSMANLGEEVRHSIGLSMATQDDVREIRKDVREVRSSFMSHTRTLYQHGKAIARLEGGAGVPSGSSINPEEDEDGQSGA